MTKQGKFPNNIYRVSAKALIMNEQRQVLCVKEGDDSYWSLPGGGIDFGESLRDGLKRELHEEVGFVGDFEMCILGVETFFNMRHDVWKMSVIVKVVPDNFNFSVGEDANEVDYKYPQEFANSIFPDERYIYEYANKVITK